MKHILNISSANCHKQSAICHKHSAISHPQPKIYKTLLTFNFLLLTLFSFSQFNVILEDTARNHIYDCETIIYNDYYTIINGASTTSRGICFTKTDTNGLLIENKIYTKSGEDWYALNNTEDYQSYKILPIGKIISDRSSALMVFNNNNDTIFTKDLKFDTLSVSLYYINRLGNSYYLTGQKKIADTIISSIIVKIDYNLDTIWTKTFSNSIDDYIGKKTIITYDTSIISIGHIYTGSAIYKQDWYIVKTDSLGNLDWWLHPGTWNLNDGAAQDIIETHDSCYVVVGGKAVYNDGASNPKFDGRIMKIDINGNVLWDKTYRVRLTESNYDSVYCVFNSIIELDDGGFAVVATSKTNDSSPNYYGKMYRFNSEGDTLWTRGYCTLCEYSTYGGPGEEYLSTIQKTENNGFVIGGWGQFYGVFDHSYTQQMILIKTDSLGCDGTEFSCPTVYLPYVAAKQEQSLLLYPNPASHNVQITINNAQLNKNASVFVYDVFGRQVSRTFLFDNKQKSLSLDISNLQKGVYFVRVGSAVGKFVKE